MPNKSYRKGYVFEKQVQKWFEDLGFLVIRQGGSKFPDLIAIPTKGDNIQEVRLVECKYNKKPSKAEVAAMMQLEQRYNVRCLFAIKKKNKKGFEFARPKDFE